MFKIIKYFSYICIKQIIFHALKYFLFLEISLNLMIEFNPDKGYYLKPCSIFFYLNTKLKVQRTLIVAVTLYLLKSSILTASHLCLGSRDKVCLYHGAIRKA